MFLAADIVRSATDPSLHACHNDVAEIAGIERLARITAISYKIDYIDLIHLLREASGATSRIIKVPYRLFQAMLASYSLIDKNPAFTTKQLAALIIPETFEVIDWPGIFGVHSTPLREAMMETFRDPVYSTISLEF